MACPTCDHTMQRLNGDVNMFYFWCPRCGTLVENSRGELTQEAPKLVNRCREFEASCYQASGWRDTSHYKRWVSIGIAESINVPTERPSDATAS